MASHRTYATWFTILRIYMGLFWLVHGIPKFVDADKFMPPNGFMPQLIAQAASSHTGFYHDFLVGVVTPNIGLFAELTRLGEVLTGCALLFGVFTRLGGLVGCFLGLNYAAAQGEFGHWSSIGSLEFIAAFVSFLMFAVPAGRVVGVDAMTARTRQAPTPAAPAATTATGQPVTAQFVDEPPQTPPAS